MNEATEATEAMRDSTGKFLPGHKGIGGRAPRAYEKGITEAIRNQWTPEVIIERLETAYDLALELRSPRAMLAVIELASAYAYGKPIQTIATGNNGKTELLEQLFAGDFSNTPLLPEKQEAAAALHVAT